MLKLFDYTVIFFHTDMNASVEKLISLPMLKLFYYTVIFFLTDMNASLEWFDQSIVPKNRQKILVVSLANGTRNPNKIRTQPIKSHRQG